MLLKISRNKRIDCLRGIAILLVLILHFHLSYHLDQSALNKILAVDFIKAIAQNGNYGVTMFFVISGFLITSTSLKRYKELGEINIINFYQLRFARIIPCLLLMLALVIIFHSVHIAIFANVPNNVSFTLAILSVITFWHNVLMAKVGYFNYCLNILWSLSVEETFYLTFPLLCLFFKRTRYIAFSWLALIIIAPIYRHFYTNNEIVALYGYLSCFDAIAIGCCTALIANKIQLNGRFGISIQYGSGLLITLVYLYSDIMANVVMGVSLVAIGTGILLLGASQTAIQPTNSTPIINRIICWFGQNSYELYLFHIIVLALMKEIYSRESLGDYSKLIWFAIFIFISSLISGTIARFYSQPANAWLRKFFLEFSQRKTLAADNY